MLFSNLIKVKAEDLLGGKSLPIETWKNKVVRWLHGRTCMGGARALCGGQSEKNCTGKDCWCQSHLDPLHNSMVNAMEWVEDLGSVILSIYEVLLLSY